MSKDTYYFTHDYHARNDPKIERMIQDLGGVSYGIYWCLVEMLYEQDGQIKKSYLPTVAKFLRVKLKTVELVVTNYDLFQSTDDLLSATSVYRRLSVKNQKKEKARVAANLRWGNDANALRTHKDTGCERIALESKEKESKGKNIKEDTTPISPTASATVDEKSLPLKKNGDEKTAIEKEVLKERLTVLGVSLSLWDDYLAMRKKQRAVPTARAVDLLIKDLEALKKQGNEPSKVLEQSITNSWRGLFALKTNSNGGNSNGEYRGNLSQRPAGAFADL